MLIRKIVLINNVGRFLRCAAVGDVELKRRTLVFAENGRGKTTLCAILRSLQSGDPTLVLGRKTLGTTSAPEIKLLVDGATVAFSGGAWTGTVPNLLIFDATFVSENVHSGEAVDLEHRRNLYKVIVGSDGVTLARRIEDLDAAVREKTGEMRERRNALQRVVPAGFTIDTFLQLQADAEVDHKIEESARQLQAVTQADQLRSRPGLAELVVPIVPPTLLPLLNSTVEDVAESVGLQVARQIEAHSMHSAGESWLAQGLAFTSSDSCPFCGQTVDGLPLLDAYRTYFSDAYRTLSANIQALREQISVSFDEREIARVERTIEQNVSAVTTWSQFCELSVPVLNSLETAATTSRQFRELAIALLDQKAAAPLAAIQSDPAFVTSYAAVTLATTDAAAYNRHVTAANVTIAARKAQADAANLRIVQSVHDRLRATKARYEAESIRLCEEYQAVVSAKTVLEAQKSETRRTLDAYTQTVIGRYEQTINQILGEFQTGFRIAGTRHAYPGGIASSTYQIVINDTMVELGDTDSSLNQPSFKNTLSSGDRSTLALAFFLAQLSNDPERASRIVVFDDPFNSQDSFRKDATIRQIKKCWDTCEQVIVLSHDQYFLKRVWDRLDSQASDRKSLQLARVGLRNTTIADYDLEVATQPGHVSDRTALSRFHNNAQGAPRDIVLKLRPVLETHCKMACPTEFQSDTLGVIVRKVGEAGTTHTLAAVVEDLDALNIYTRRYHHGDSLAATAEPIDNVELQGFVERTLSIIGGC